jgi:hypothetical protein
VILSEVWKGSDDTVGCNGCIEMEAGTRVVWGGVCGIYGRAGEVVKVTRER